MTRNVLVAVLALGLLVAAGPVFAHHSISAEFDLNNPIEFTGTVKQVDWLNPHIYTHVDVIADNGTTITYKVEGSPPNSLYRRGWRKDTLMPGDTITVEGVRAKSPDSTNVGQATILMEDGTRAFSGNPPR